MATRTTDIPSGIPQHSGGQFWARGLRYAIYMVTLALVLLATYALIGLLVEYTSVVRDDWRYGRPRTTHLSGFIGHNEGRGLPTHITAINLERRVVIIELPGGDPAAARAFEGPYLIGADEALTPVDLLLRDADGDGSADLIVTIRREQIVFLNKDGSFRLPTPTEQATLTRVEP